MHRRIRTSEPRPYDRVLFCGICGLEVHVTRSSSADWIDGHFSPEDAERCADDHLTERHPWRYWLWKKFRWRWLVAGLAS